MNPPYQNSSGNKGSNNTLWDRFVFKTFDILKEGGYVCAVHPSGWRNIGGQKGVGQLLKSKQMEYLKIHSLEDGIKTFGASTRFDFYCVKNVENSILTKIVDENGKENIVNVKHLDLIPNFGFEVMEKLVVKLGEEKVQIIKNSSYHTHNHNKGDVIKIAQEKSESNPYPVVYSVNTKDEPKFKWSSFNNKGHFGLPKVIFGSGATGFFVDKTGEYGQTEFARGIVDKVENLENIKSALKSSKFKSVIKMMSIGASEINVDILATFKKDFWKEFI